jgi:phosphoribosyl 1,2-cyclic phosphodiesterase
MAITVCVLASGSAANCVYVASERTRILVDAGLSGRETARRLAEIGASLDAVDAVCVTHEHNDHCAAISILHRRHGLPLYANSGTIQAIERDEANRGLPWRVFTTGSAFEVGDLRVDPFSVPHDSYDPVGFVISAEGTQVGVVTDMGMPSSLIRERLRRCAAMVVESNHDEQMLKNAKRPWALKQRIAGRQGHLSNRQTCELLAEIAGPHLQAVFLAHLSAECNRPALALEAAESVLRKNGHTHVAVRLTYPDRVSDMICVT